MCVRGDARTMKKTKVGATIDSELKQKAGEILSRLGIRHSEAINIFYRMIVEYKGLPFQVRLPEDTKENPPLTLSNSAQILRPEILSQLKRSIRLNHRLGQGLS